MSSIVRRFLFPPVIQKKKKRGLSFKLIYICYIYPYNFQAQCKSTFSATFFHPCVILLKMIKKKTEKKTKDVNAKYTLKSFETNTNVLKPSVSLPRLL